MINIELWNLAPIVTEPEITELLRPYKSMVHEVQFHQGAGMAEVEFTGTREQAAEFMQAIDGKELRSYILHARFSTYQIEYDATVMDSVSEVETVTKKKPRLDR